MNKFRSWLCQLLGCSRLFYNKTLDEYLKLDDEVKKLRADDKVQFIDPTDVDEVFNTSDSIDDFIKKL